MFEKITHRSGKDTLRKKLHIGEKIHAEGRHAEERHVDVGLSIILIYQWNVSRETF